MRDIHSFEPIWENWIIDEKIDEGSYGIVWKAHREDQFSHVQQYAAVKHISIPRQEGAGEDDVPFPDEETRRQYYRSILNRLITEIDAMVSLRGKPNIVSYEEHKVVPKGERGGYDLFLRMELLTSVPKYIGTRKKLLTREEVIKLGIDIASALEILQSKKFVHRDIKPANIFIDADGDFKLGDFGTARVLEGTGGASTMTGTPNYMAPEVYGKSSDYDQTVDIYSLGIVLYRYLNNDYLPFMSSTCLEADVALLKRVRGEPLAPPSKADKELARIILKACAFQPEERYQTATEFKRDLLQASQTQIREISFPVFCIMEDGTEIYREERSIIPNSEIIVDVPEICAKEGYQIIGESNLRVSADEEGRISPAKVQFVLRDNRTLYLVDVAILCLDEDEKVLLSKTEHCYSGQKNIITAPSIEGYHACAPTEVDVTVLKTHMAKPNPVTFHYTKIQQKLETGVSRHPQEVKVPIICRLESGAELLKTSRLCRNGEENWIEAPDITGYVLTGKEKEQVSIQVDGSAKPKTVVFLYKGLNSETLDKENTAGNKEDGSNFPGTEPAKMEVPEKLGKDARKKKNIKIAMAAVAILLIAGGAFLLFGHSRSHKTYTVTWVYEDGTVLEKDENVAQGVIPEYNGSIPVKEENDAASFQFAGWSPEISEVTGDVTYIAVFDETLKMYTITWQDEHGNTIDTTKAVYGTVPIHEAPTKEADRQYSYDFSGWTPEIQEITADATYRATYQETDRTYKIIWQDDQGNTIDTTEMVYGTVPTHEDVEKEASSQYFYSFTGWTPEIKEVTGDAAYRATFQEALRSYRITWQDENGKTIGTTETDYGTVPVFEDQTKAADSQYIYTFVGWTPRIEKVTGNATYRASFRQTLRNYTIIWQDENGKNIQTTTADYGTLPTHDDITKPDDEKYTYTFAGWTPDVKTATGEAIYKARFTKQLRKYKITWLNAEGEIINTAEVAYGEIPTYDDPVKESNVQYNYTFAGWTPSIKTVSGDATYKATFRQTPRTYTITWKNADGKTLHTSKEAYGTIPTHSALTKAADEQFTYTFKGWTPEIKTVTEDATYTAIFRKETRKYTITWLGENGKTIGTTKVPYGTVPTHAAPTKKGYEFAGWTPERVSVTGDATYKATFTYKETFEKPSELKKESVSEWICENCKAHNSFEDHFCPECGKTRLCLECGKSVPKEDKYCGNCRMEVGYWKCASCGEINLDENNICVNCTTKRHEPSNSQSAAEDKTNRSYTITWQNADGKTIDTTQVAYGEIPAHRGPGKASNAQFSYTFMGWTPDVKAVTGDATYKAKYKQELQKYNITWLDADGKRIDVTSVTYGEIPSHDDPIRAADTKYTYSFAGWVPEIKKVTGFATYKAQFTAIMIRWTCENCQTENSFDDHFCPECGQTRVCLECGASAPKEDKYCGNCKMELGHWKCANCGENNPGEDVFCGNCAAKRHNINASELKLPDDTTEYQGHYYKVFKTRTSWTNANSECKKSGGHLLTINSLKEQAIIRNFVTKSRGDVLRCWLGLTDNGKNGQWKNWITGEDLTYTNWAPGQPDSSDKGPHYASMACDSLGWISLGQWDDGYNNPSNNDFDKKSGYICEWESWDCSNCKRKGNTKNFCGECATSAPWMK